MVLMAAGEQREDGLHQIKGVDPAHHHQQLVKVVWGPLLVVVVGVVDAAGVVRVQMQTQDLDQEETRWVKVLRGARPRSGPSGAAEALTMGRRCRRASPVSEPTAKLTQNWMTSWKALVQEVHRSITIPISAARVITALARVAYRYSGDRRRT